MEILCRNEVYFHEVYFVFYDADICCPFKVCENDAVFRLTMKTGDVR